MLARGIWSALKNADGVVTLHLRPEELGAVRVKVSMSGGEVTAVFEAANDRARAVLEESAPSLRAALENRGLVVDRIEVHADHNSLARDDTDQHDAPGDGSAPADRDGLGGWRDGHRSSDDRGGNGGDDRPARTPGQDGQARGEDLPMGVIDAIA